MGMIDSWDFGRGAMSDAVAALLQATRIIKDLQEENERLKGELYEATSNAHFKIERLRAQNHYLFELIMDDALLVERYNAFVERAALAKDGVK